LLSLVFLGAAAAKAHEILGGGGTDAGRWSAMSNPWSRGAMVMVDLAIVTLLLTRQWRAGSAAAVIVAAGGNVVYAAALHDGRFASACGCLGRLALTPLQHVVLSAVVFALACWTLAGGAPSRTFGS
jgi:hypothetical protein